MQQPLRNKKPSGFNCKTPGENINFEESKLISDDKNFSC
jgi:hypothetical protein